MSLLNLMSSTAYKLWYTDTKPSMTELNCEEIKLEEAVRQNVSLNSLCDLLAFLLTKLGQKQRCATYGYTWIRPVGINKTLQEQAELEEQARQVAEEAGGEEDIDAEVDLDNDEDDEDAYEQMDSLLDSVQTPSGEDGIVDTNEVNLDADVTNEEMSDFYDSIDEY
ncbi:anaphase-promoting complex subunit Apc15 [Schizosaccharomyces japonicus yFS275]|uniref:Anaphase-promoting complex subunit Apc15 n=1 Tax=Schizosaccharomyces japonicus (strain yFS275 / FY16936) TaxID=402676 RepID=B6K355_SCHJY|nr:anaphase-promoting complex subunit Apc15 [Schizosaccharomyces japonicus yFS275]EEB07912.1 anaphase-promoting complex subunit Apc15 [Schizosaccharomyces japonicus yFS275]